MNKISIIIIREYLTKIKKPSFILLTFLTPFLIILFGLIIIALNRANESKQQLLYVHDETGLVNNQNLPDYHLFSFHFLDTLEQTPEEIYASDSIFGLLVVPPFEKENINQLGNNIKIYSDKIPDLNGLSYISGKLEKVFEKAKMNYYNIDSQLLEKTKVSVDITYIDSQKNIKDTTYTNIRRVMGYVLSFIIYMFIFIYGAQIMRSVLEEKTTRVVEVIISCVKPFELMIGKIIADLGLAITQLLLWVILLSSGYLILTTMMEPESFLITPNIKGIFFSLQDINYFYVLSNFLFFFLFGYLLYGALFAMIGSVSDTETDSHQIMWVISTPLLLAIYVSFGTSLNPHGPVAIVFSIFPFTSPVSMMMRIPFGVPLWQLLLSMGTLLITFYGILNFTSKIYRIGILTFGKKTKYKDLFVWFRQKN